jgi:hypothetical protein
MKKQSYVLVTVLSLAFMFGMASHAYAATPMQRIQLMRYHFCLSNFSISPVNRAASCSALLPR